MMQTAPGELPNDPRHVAFPVDFLDFVHAMNAHDAPDVVFDRALLDTADTVTAFGEPPMRTDLLANISGVSFDDAQAGAVRENVSGEALQVIGLTALRANKRASRRKKDWDDLKQLPDPEPLARRRVRGKSTG